LLIIQLEAVAASRRLVKTNGPRGVVSTQAEGLKPRSGQKRPDNGRQEQQQVGMQREKKPEAPGVRRDDMHGASPFGDRIMGEPGAMVAK
jgi:hypothetical protein